MSSIDLNSRKLAFIREFLSLQHEDAIARLEKSLQQEVNSPVNPNQVGLTEKKLNKNIDQSEDDFEKGKVKSVEELREKYKK